MKKYINNKNDLEEFLCYESVLYKRKSTRIPIICIRENDYLWKHNVLLRKTEYYTNTNKKILGCIYKILLLRYQNMNQIHIPINTFDKGLHIIHLGPILVNGNATCGKDIVLHINTCIVAGGINNDVPIIGDGVVVGVGAVILGNVKLANNIAIGANAVVNKSFDEENITIAGVTAHKISDRGRLDWNK